MDRPLKAVPVSQISCFTIYTVNTTRSCVLNLYKLHTAPTASRQHNASVLKTGLSEDAHFFQKTTNDVGVLKQRHGKHQQYISNGFTLSLQKELNTFLNELFNATLAERISSERACIVSQL